MSQKLQLLSLVIPVHNEEGNLVWHHELITREVVGLGCKYEVVYVNDGSTDNSLSLLKTIAANDNHVSVINFSRNFGKEAATSAGLKKCEGDAVIMLDADGQHPVKLIKVFLDKWHEGYQVVIGVRESNTKEGIVKHYGSMLFYRLIISILKGNTVPRSTDFRLLDRRVIDEFNKLTEHNRMTRGLIDWLGFRRTTVSFQAPARHSGEASYRFSKLVKLALYAFVSQSTKPLQLGGILGACTMVISAFVGIFLLFEKYVFRDPLRLAVTGSAMVALFVSFLVGIVLICQWLLALYIESIHNETQNRPLYIIDEEIR